nr:inosine triphosphate pyrophosphatase-like [Dermacentor andersoni]
MSDSSSISYSLSTPLSSSCPTSPVALGPATHAISQRASSVASRIVFVTGNKDKLREVVAILGKIPGFELDNRAVELVEPQGESDAVCQTKCETAARLVGGPGLVEDTSLCFNALGGLPRPYVKWFLDKIGSKGLHRMLAVGGGISLYVVPHPILS